MILFVPGYDPATRANLAVAEHLSSADCRPLLGEDATRAELWLALASPGIPLLAMTHGRRDRLAGQGGEVAVDLEGVRAMEPRAVFAFACHTATELGETAARHGIAWWGYTGAIQAPPDSSSLLPWFVEIFTCIRDSFARADSTEALRAAISRIAVLCHEVEWRVDALLETTPDPDAGPAYFCLLHIWQRLRSWEPGAAAALLHPNAPPPELFL